MPTVSIPSFRQGKPVLYIVRVDLDKGIPPYSLERRYNDFLKLARDVEAEMGEPVMVAPPAKPGLFGSVDYEQRRAELEAMLIALVRVPEFAESLSVSTFLEVFAHRRAKPRASVDWIHLTTEISRLITDARNSTQALQIRQKIVQAKTLVGQLQRSLQNESKDCGAGERTRRQQQLDNYLFTLRQLETKNHVGVVFDGMGDAETATSSISTGAGRVLGETAETRKLNNRGLLDSQQVTMEEQDEMIEDLRLAILRQKELGMAIHSELGKQNEMLETLDEDVHRVNAKLNQARRKTAELQ